MNRFLQKMAGSVGAAMLLLLTSLHTGINGQNSLIIAGETYDVTFPCGQDGACYDAWFFRATRRGHLIAVVRNGEFLASASEADDSKCTTQKENRSKENAGRRPCQDNPEATATPEIVIKPGEALSLQCVFLSYVKNEHCHTPQQQTMALRWADEDGAPIQEDPEQQVERRSPCDATLTVNPLSPANRSFTCQVIIDGSLRTFAEFRVRVKGVNGRGRVLIIEPQPEHQGHSYSVIGTAVGAAACVVLTAVVAAFAVRRRRTTRTRTRRSKNQQTPDESCYTISKNNDVYSEEVLYADIVLPITSARLQLQEFESTEYACVRYE